MYLEHYGFTRDPFHITPDPRFFYLSSSHREAYASMIYGLKQRKGFIAVVGEVGLGKTTVVRSFLQQKSSQTKMKTIFIFNPSISFRGLLRFIFEELEIELPASTSVESDDTSELVKKLHRALIEEYSKGYLIVLVIDEAQNMPIDTLENLRMLSNLETTQDKLLQIFLVGQPELERKLNRPELRQLKQRLAIRSTLKPLNRKETYQYIEHRLKKAGLQNQTIFGRRALHRIYRYSKGNPRIVNILCDNALVTGFGYGTTHIGPTIIKEVRKDIEGTGYRPGKLAWSAAAAAVLLLVGGGFWYSPYGGSAKRELLQLPVVSQVHDGAQEEEHAASGTAMREAEKKTSIRTNGSEKSSRQLAARSKRLMSRTPEVLPSAVTVVPSGDSLADGEHALGGTASRNEPEQSGFGPDGALRNQAGAPFSYENSILPAEFDQKERAIRMELVKRLDVFQGLSPVRQRVLVAMAKQTSINGLMTFDRMIAALERQDYREAARQMIHSHWGDRVGMHAVKLAEIMYTGHPRGWNSGQTR
jgi:general secretion pathway protein A